MTIDTAEQTLRWLGACHGKDDQIHCLQQWHDAIRRLVANEVLDAAEQELCNANILRSSFAFTKLRNKYGPQERPATDSTVERKAKVEVLSGVIAMSLQWLHSTSGPVTTSRLRSTRESVYEVAARHGIQPHELEPVKPYTVEAIRLVAGRLGYSIDCVDREWSVEEDRWVESGNKNLGFVTAAAIADHLRARQHLPGGGK